LSRLTSIQFWLGVTYWAENDMPLFVQIIDQLQKPLFLTANYIKTLWENLAPEIFPIGGSVVHAIFWEICWPSLFHCNGLQKNDLHTKVIHCLLNAK